MSALQWLKDNRLKLVGFLFLAGDVFLGAAGAYARQWPLSVGAVFGMLANLILLAYGKGGQAVEPATRSGPKNFLTAANDLVSRRHVEVSFGLGLGAGAGFILAGLDAQNGFADPAIGMTMSGLAVIAANLVAVFGQEPAENQPVKPVLGLKIAPLRPLQVASSIFMMATIGTIVAAVETLNPFIIAAAASYGTANLILHTARKNTVRASARPQPKF